MENAFLVSLSHLSALKREMDVIANNLANVNTDAFKSEGVLFEEFISEEAQGGDPAAPKISFVLDYGVVRNMAVGTLTHTGNPLDVAISGEGYFAVQTEDEIAYTRSGHFNVNNKGQLVTTDGQPVLNAQMQPITIPPGSEMPVITADGTISGPGVPKQQLGFFTFDDQQALQKIGANLLTTDEERKPVPRAKINLVQGSVESSNVEPVAQITRMIEVMRKYQSAAQLTENDDELTRKAIDQLPRIR